jgi:hypothetical protein
MGTGQYEFRSHFLLHGETRDSYRIRRSKMVTFPGLSLSLPSEDLTSHFYQLNISGLSHFLRAVKDETGCL